MQVQLKGDNSAILSTFIERPFVVKIFFCLFLSDRFYTGFTVCCFISDSRGHKKNQLAKFSFYGIE